MYMYIYIYVYIVNGITMVVRCWTLQPENQTAAALLNLLFSPKQDLMICAPKSKLLESAGHSKRYEMALTLNPPTFPRLPQPKVSGGWSWLFPWAWECMGMMVYLQVKGNGQLFISHSQNFKVFSSLPHLHSHGATASYFELTHDLWEWHFHHGVCMFPVPASVEERWPASLWSMHQPIGHRCAPIWEWCLRWEDL